MKRYWTKEQGAFDDDWDQEEGAPNVDFINWSSGPPTLFHIGQSYIDTPVPTLTCKGCEGNTFHVGSADYFTAVKCTTCGWEAGIHEG